MDKNSVAARVSCDPYTIETDDGEYLEFIPCKTGNMVLTVWEKMNDMIDEQLKVTPRQSKSLLLNTLLANEPTKFPFERLWVIFLKGSIVGFVHTRVEVDETEPPVLWLHLINVYKKKTYKSDLTKHGITFLKEYVMDLRQIYNYPVREVIAFSTRRGAEKLFTGMGFKKGLVQYIYEV